MNLQDKIQLFGAIASFMAGIGACASAYIMRKMRQEDKKPIFIIDDTALYYRLVDGRLECKSDLDYTQPPFLVMNNLGKTAKYITIQFAFSKDSAQNQLESLLKSGIIKEYTFNERLITFKGNDDSYYCYRTDKNFFELPIRYIEDSSNQDNVSGFLIPKFITDNMHHIATLSLKSKTDNNAYGKELFQINIRYSDIYDKRYMSKFYVSFMRTFQDKTKNEYKYEVKVSPMPLSVDEKMDLFFGEIES